MKAIVITGASRGIGHHLAVRLVESGYRVVGVARNFSADLGFETLTCDVSNPDSVQAAFASFRKQKDISGLINCAGVLHTRPVAAISPGELNEIVDTNLKGTIYCCKNIIRPLLAYGAGRIINFSSIAAHVALRGDSVYSASKSAVETFTRAFAKEMAERAVTVNCIAPGVIKTSMTQHLTDEQTANLISLQTIQRQATPEDVWHVVKFLLSDEAAMITGQSLSIGG